MPVSEEARVKKVFANRVRRICLAHDIEIVYDGVIHNYSAVELVKNGQVMFADRATGRKPLNIDWQRLFAEVTDYGFKCRERKVS
jgi:hypothetical protein|tara:strand:+ start:572 stop:826 length:255 start_codon:yes stop_codon:yes gene_type:complete